LELVGSSVNTDSDPVTADPAVAVPAILAVTVMTEGVPGVTVRDVGLIENALPACEADTCSGDPPELLMVSVLVPDAPQPTEPKSMAVAENDATGGAAGAASLASCSVASAFEPLA
jgi:hypothetical protein